MPANQPISPAGGLTLSTAVPVLASRQAPQPQQSSSSVPASPQASSGIFSPSSSLFASKPVSAPPAPQPTSSQASNAPQFSTTYGGAPIAPGLHIVGAPTTSAGEYYATFNALNRAVGGGGAGGSGGGGGGGGQPNQGAAIAQQLTQANAANQPTSVITAGGSTYLVPGLKTVGTNQYTFNGVPVTYSVNPSGGLQLSATGSEPILPTQPSITKPTVVQAPSYANQNQLDAFAAQNGLYNANGSVISVKPGEVLLVLPQNFPNPQSGALTQQQAEDYGRAVVQYIKQSQASGQLGYQQSMTQPYGSEYLQPNWFSGIKDATLRQQLGSLGVNALSLTNPAYASALNTQNTAQPRLQQTQAQPLSTIPSSSSIFYNASNIRFPDPSLDATLGGLIRTYADIFSNPAQAITSFPARYNQLQQDTQTVAQETNNPWLPAFVNGLITLPLAATGILVTPELALTLGTATGLTSAGAQMLTNAYANEPTTFPQATSSFIQNFGIGAFLAPGAEIASPYLASALGKLGAGSMGIANPFLRYGLTEAASGGGSVGLTNLITLASGHGLATPQQDLYAATAGLLFPNIYEAVGSAYGLIGNAAIPKIVAPQKTSIVLSNEAEPLLGVARFANELPTNLYGSTTSEYQTLGSLENQVNEAIAQEPANAQGIHVTLNKGFYDQLRKGGVAYVNAPTELGQGFRNLFGTDEFGNPLYTSAPSVTSKGVANQAYLGYAFGSPESEISNVPKSGIPGRAFGLRFQINDVLSPQDYAEVSGTGRQLNVIRQQVANGNLRSQVNDAQDFYRGYSAYARSQGKIIYSPVSTFLAKGETELVIPPGAVLQGTPNTQLDIALIRPNQGLYRDIPIAENLFPTTQRLTTQLANVLPTFLTTEQLAGEPTSAINPALLVPSPISSVVYDPALLASSPSLVSSPQASSLINGIPSNIYLAQQALANEASQSYQNAVRNLYLSQLPSSIKQSVLSTAPSLTSSSLSPSASSLASLSLPPSFASSLSPSATSSASLVSPYVSSPYSRPLSSYSVSPSYVSPSPSSSSYSPYYYLQLASNPAFLSALAAQARGKKALQIIEPTPSYSARYAPSIATSLLNLQGSNIDINPSSPSFGLQLRPFPSQLSLAARRRIALAETPKEAFA